MQLQKCAIDDVPELARLNKQLIEDEQSSNPMSIPELESRMKGFLKSGYSAYFFTEDGQVIGYALIRHTGEPVYLRQFLIERNFRGRHYGTRAFQLLMQHLGVTQIDLEVLPWNQAGLTFWRQCGFQETCIAMRYQTQ